MRDLIRPRRQKAVSPRPVAPPKGKKKKRGFTRWLFRLVLFVCIISALPMIALRYYDPPTSMFIELNKQSNNKDIKHEWRDIEDISAYFPVAVIASEDQAFPTHFGFDLKQIQLVLEDRKNGLSRGASTISQQTIKNLFLWPDRSLVRKAIEAWLTLWLELIVPKKRILELYVNFAQFGKSVFGVGAASQYYFKIPASQLTPRQSALIAASLPTPSRSNPAKPSDYLKERAAFIQDQMPRIGGRRLISEL
ncbi:MAG: monofunctional biosynthetic peptidoglycan transglycosylase [Pseudomonadota bacterium]